MTKHLHLPLVAECLGEASAQLAQPSVLPRLRGANGEQHAGGEGGRGRGVKCVEQPGAAAREGARFQHPPPRPSSSASSTTSSSAALSALRAAGEPQAALQDEEAAQHG